LAKWQEQHKIHKKTCATYPQKVFFWNKERKGKGKERMYLYSAFIVATTLKALKWKKRTEEQ